jgi:D-alanine-D-alanine ligase
MLFGLTYDLKDDYVAAGLSDEEAAEFDKPETISGIETALQELGHRTARVGQVHDLVKRLATGERWDMVFNICEGRFGVGREAQVPALLDAYEIPYVFSDPMVLSLTLHKGMTKRVVRDLGVPTPDFRVVEKAADADRIDLPFPLFAKPVAEGTGKGIGADSVIRDAGELRSVCQRLLAAFRQPVLVETFLPGREFTAGVVGSGPEAEVVGVMEITAPGQTAAVYSYENKKYYEDNVRYHLVTGEAAAECRQVTLDAWRGLGCRDGGRIDLRQDASGRVNFIEVNPLAGLHPVDSDLPIICRMAGMSYRELIGRIVASAQGRMAK